MVVALDEQQFMLRAYRHAEVVHMLLVEVPAELDARQPPLHQAVALVEHIAVPEIAPHEVAVVDVDDFGLGQGVEEGCGAADDGGDEHALHADQDVERPSGYTHE